jgi:DNA invertase Pin-like site-specific DNA recombinase
MKIGIYARISSESSSSDNQLMLLRDFCEKMEYEIIDEYVETISGGAASRPEFSRMMQDASKRNWDMLLFYALDRFSREGTRQTIHYLQMLDDYGVSYKSFTEQFIDSSGVFKDVIIALLSTLAKQERIRIGERVKAGLELSRRQGRIGGRPKLDTSIVERIKEWKSKGRSVISISQELGISRGSVYNYLNLEE